MANFEQAFERMLRNEGGLKLHKVAGDTGGATYGGIARNKNPQWLGWTFFDRGETPPTELVRRFYLDRFWDPLRLSEVQHQRVAENIFDFAVNAGQGTSARLAQIVAGVVADGVIGPKTLSSLNMIEPDRFIPLFALAKLARYRDIVTRDRTQQKFLLGWINRTLAEAK